MNAYRLNLLSVVSTVVLFGATAVDCAQAEPINHGRLTPRTHLGANDGSLSLTIGTHVLPQPVEPIKPAPYYQRDYGTLWPSASRYERIRIAEKIGNQGRARYAAEQGWRKLLGSQKRGLVQGPDSLYWDPHSGRVRALEAKGGYSQPKLTYGSIQGTNTNVIRSAARALLSAKASPAETVACARAIVAAQQGQLETGIVSTRHTKLSPGHPRLKGPWDRVDVSKEARRIENSVVRKRPELAKAFADARRGHTVDMLRYRAGQGVAMFGFIGAAGLGWDAYNESREAWAMFHDSSLTATPLPIMQSGIAAGRWGQSASLGLGSAAHLGLLGKGVSKAFGQAAGKWFLPIAIGVEGAKAGTAYYEYSTGRISQRDLYRRTSGPAIFAVFTTGGAIIGGVTGAPAGGVGAGPGALVGAGIGALVAVPGQFAADWTWNWYYKEFDETQRKALDAVVEKTYAAETR